MLISTFGLGFKLKKTTMKKTILLGAIALISLSTFAQDKSDDSRITYGVKAGVTFPTVTGGDAIKSITSFYVGGMVDIPVSSMFSVQPGLSFIGKGYIEELDYSAFGLPEGDVVLTFKSNPFYIEIPVNLVAKFEAGPGKLFVGAGPYVSFGVAGKLKRTFSGTQLADLRAGDSIVADQLKDVEADLKFGTNKDLKSLDFGLNFLLGYQLTNGLSINGGYGLGLTGIKTDSASIKNSVISVGLGFAF